MHKMVGLVFKILMMSILLMFLLDTTLLLIEVISVHSKINNITGMMQMEVARNNCMPTDAANMFRTYLDDIAVNSKIMDNDGSDIITNMTSAVHLDGVGIIQEGKGDGEADPLTPAFCKNYGEFATLAVQANINPLFAYIPSRANNGVFLGRIADNRVSINYIYKVPCLRYLK